MAWQHEGYLPCDERAGIHIGRVLASDVRLLSYVTGDTRMKAIMLAGAAAVALLAAAPAFAAGSNGGEPFIDPNAAPSGFYSNDPGLYAWGPRVTFSYNTVKTAAATPGWKQHEAKVFRNAANNGLG
jgi:hypothetical protein